MRLLRYRIRPWFALLAITALKSGTKLPITLKSGEQKVLNKPKGLFRVSNQVYSTIIHSSLATAMGTESRVSSPGEPEVFESIIHASFLT